MTPNLSLRLTGTSVLDCVAAALVLEGREIEPSFALMLLPPTHPNKLIDGFMSPSSSSEGGNGSKSVNSGPQGLEEASSHTSLGSTAARVNPCKVAYSKQIGCHNE